MSENEFTIKEVLKEHMLDINKKIDTIVSDVKEIKTQTAGTRDDVIEIQTKIFDYNTVKKDVAELKTEKAKAYTTLKVVITIFGLFTGIFGTLFFYLINSKLDNLSQRNEKLIKEEVSNAVSSVLENYHLEGIVR